jgi:hypothetical protein
MRRLALVAVLLAGSSLAAQTVDLPALLTTGRLTVVNRTASKLEGDKPGVRLSAGANPGVAWLEGVTFTEGTIEIDVRGKDVPQQSFLGVAFHGKDNNTYEVVYLRPFNFRATDPARHQHAIQYALIPDHDWPRLRAEFPEEFENPVDASVSPTDWVPLKIVVAGQKIQIFVGAGSAPALEVRKLGTLTGGKIGLWVGNTSDGDFGNLRVTAAR